MFLTAATPRRGRAALPLFLSATPHHCSVSLLRVIIAGRASLSAFLISSRYQLFRTTFPGHDALALLPIIIPTASPDRYSGARLRSAIP